MQSLEIGRLIRDAWGTTLRYRFLWILALFAGGAAGGASGGGGRWRAGGGGSPQGTLAGSAPASWRLDEIDPKARQAAETAAQWAAGHVAWLVTAGVVAALLGLTLVVVWLIAQGGMAEATVELGTGQRTSLGRAWRGGMHFFWRYAGLWLALIALSIVVAAFVGAGVAMALGAGSMVGSQGVTLVLALVFGLPLVVFGIAVGVATSIVVAYAQRAIAAEDDGPLAALRAGLQLLVARPWESLLTWIVSIALAIGTGIVGAIVLTITGALLVGIGVALWALAGMGPAVIAYAALGILGVMAVMALVAAIANTFFWNYWTLAYLRLGGPVHQPA